MTELLQKLTAVERLELYVNYLKNKKQYSDEEQALLEELFEEDG